MDSKAQKSAGSTPEDSPSTSSGRKRKSRGSDVGVEPRTPLKRQRVPVSRFQSPLEELEPKFKVEKEEKKKDDNITLYKKGAFLAVRGAEGTFYLCRAAQNIYSKSRRLKIQWLTLDKPPNVYKFDYVDTTEMETVLTEINMEKVSKDGFKLPSSEQKRAEKILDRAIRVEKGIATADEVEEEAMVDNRDEDESSEEEEEEPSPKTNEKKSTPKGKKTKSNSAQKKRKEEEKASKQKDKTKAAGKQKGKVEKRKDLIEI